MDNNERLIDINNEMKIYVNEATFISNQVLKKMLKLICKYFYVNLPTDNYLRVSVEIKENGNVIMKDDEYYTANKPNDINEVFERYENFKNEIEIILKRKEISFDKKRMKKDLINFLLTLFFTILFIIIVIYSIINFLSGNIIGSLWIFIVVVPLITPKIKERYAGALRFVKNLFKK